nr:MAG TPA: hypothetical protein [Caudoviricetes sp.]
MYQLLPMNSLYYIIYFMSSNFNYLNLIFIAFNNIFYYV